MNKYYSLVEEDRSADLYIFGDITSWKWLESDVSSYSLAKEIQQLDVDNINVHINSYGGEVAEALAIYNVLKRQEANVTTYVDGFACSAATIVFMAGDKRIMSKVGNFLVHPAWAWVQGNSDDLRAEAENLDAITEQSITAYLEHITKTREELVELMEKEKFLTPEEVLEWGFATEIEDEAEALHAAASVRDKIHKMLIDQDDLDDLTSKIDDLKAAVDELSAKIDEEEDPEEEPEEEPEAEPEPDEEPKDPEEEPEDPEEPDDKDNQKASVKGCFFDAFKK